MRRLLPIALLAWLCQGCFVLEEIDKGQAMLDKHSPRGREEQARQAEPPARRRDGEEGLLQGLRSWWETAWEPAPVQRDPEDVAVACELAGRVQFMRKSDCALRGGRIL